ncbi:MAG: DUF4159 domain-containing protein [Pyrinomonadaceae bacterium]
MSRALRNVLIFAAVAAWLFSPAIGQQRLGTALGTMSASPGENRMRAGRSAGEFGEFTFARAVYDSPGSPYNWWFGGAWRVDYPEADEHFVTGISEWVGTNLSVSPRPVHLRLTDDRLFDYPLTYLVEPGHMELSDEEAARLREYLLRGGFLFLDDLHGDYEWGRVQRQLSRVFPEYEIKDLPPTHPIFHSYLDINEVVQVPGVASLVNGVTYEKGGVTPHYMGIENKDGRLMVFMTRNCDLGDAWEWINDSRYPVQYGVMAYRIGINVIVYAMTH